MAGQAGWYRAPGEEGLLRYWNGTIWTEHRQPDPAAVVAPEPELPSADPDPMAEYERQFTAPTVDYSSFDRPGLDRPGLDRPGFDFDSHPFDTSSATPEVVETPDTNAPVSAPQAQYHPQTALTSPPVVPVAEPEFAGQSSPTPRSLGPIALGPVSSGPTSSLSGQTVDTPESEFERMYRELNGLAPAPAPVADPLPDPVAATGLRPAAEALQQPAQEPAANELAPQAAEGAPAPLTIVAPSRKAVMVAVRIMVAAVILILLGIGATLVSSLQSSAGPGEVRTNAIVTSLGKATASSCTPIARFAVEGKSYTANSSAAISPCPIGLGESVNVVYSAANPASAARIEVGSSVTQYLWLVSILGGLLFVVGLIVFIIRAGSFVAGIRLLRAGRSHEDAPVRAE